MRALSLAAVLCAVWPVPAAAGAEEQDLAALEGAPPAPAPHGGQPADPWRLYRGLLDSDGIEVSVLAPVGPEVARLAAESLARRAPLEAWAEGDERAAEADPARTVRVVAGVRGTPEVDAFARSLGIEVVEDGFLVAGRKYAGPRDVLVLTREDPVRAGLPATLLLANATRPLVGLLLELEPAWRPAFALWRDGEPDRHGRLIPGGHIDPVHLVDLARPRTLRSHSVRPVWRGPLKLMRPEGLGDEAFDDYARSASIALGRTRALTGIGNLPGGIRVDLYAHAGDMGSTRGTLGRGLVSPVSGAAHVLVDPFVPHDDGAAVARAAMLAGLGPPARPWVLDGASLLAARRFWGRGLGEHVARLVRAGVVPPVEELLAPDAGARRSPLVVDPLRAVLVQVVFARGGQEEVRRLWLEELVPDDELRAAWEDTLAGLVEQGDRAAEAAGRREEALARASRRGIVLSRSGDPVREGLAARRTERSLERARSLGIDAVLLRVDSYADGGLPPHPVRTSVGGLPASDPDAALARVAGWARESGVGVLLEPRLLTRPSGGIAGRGVLDHTEDWTEFFDQLERTTTHYALLADLLGCEIYSLASELSRTTSFEALEAESGPEQEEILAVRRTRWAGLIELARSLFDGAVTYSAASSHDRVSFRRSLDFHAVKLFDGVWRPGRARARNPYPNAAELVNGFVNLLGGHLELAEKSGLPLLVTSIGSPSTTRPWLDPSRADRELDLEAQRLMIAALGAALSRPDPGFERLAGVYLWDWSSDPDHGGSTHRGHTPQNKPAELEVGRFGASR
jgi:hypothetical protein